jgi:hypothetical protein
MNNRMGVVDTWRLIYFNANQLKSGLNLTFAGGLDTTNNNPVRFRGNAGDASVGVQFSAPLTRRLQRNNFRAQLFSYQQARRGLIAYQDSIYQLMRNYLRSLKQLEILLEIQRRAMVIAVRRADQTREILNQPPAPARPTGPGEIAEQPELLPPTAAQNLIFALGDLRTAGTNLMSAWLNHYETRMMLYRDLGIMELDDEGMWIDRPFNEAEWLEEEICPLPPPIPNRWLVEVDIEGDAEYEPMVPGFGSRRADVNEGETPGMQEIFPEPPLEENMPLPAPSEIPTPTSGLRPGGDIENRRRLWFNSYQQPPPDVQPAWYHADPEVSGFLRGPPGH